MAEKYPILLKKTIIPTLFTGNISDVVLSLIAEDELNFQVSMVDSDEILLRHAEYLEAALHDNTLEFQNLDDIGPIIGYNRRDLLPTISNPKNSVGAIEIIGRQLVFYERGQPLHLMYDSYVTGYALNQFFVSRNPIDIVKEFLEKGYEIFIGENQVYKPGLLKARQVTQPKKVTFEDIKDKL